MVPVWTGRPHLFGRSFFCFLALLLLRWFRFAISCWLWMNNETAGLSESWNKGIQWSVVWLSFANLCCVDSCSFGKLRVLFRVGLVHKARSMAQHGCLLPWGSCEQLHQIACILLRHVWQAWGLDTKTGRPPDRLPWTGELMHRWPGAGAAGHPWGQRIQHFFCCDVWQQDNGLKCLLGMLVAAASVVAPAEPSIYLPGSRISDGTCLNGEAAPTVGIVCFVRLVLFAFQLSVLHFLCLFCTIYVSSCSIWFLTSRVESRAYLNHS